MTLLVRPAWRRPGLAVASLIAALFASSLATSCKKPPAPLAVRKVLIDVAPGAEGPGGVLEREAVRRLVADRIANDARIASTQDRDGAVLRVRLESAALTGGADGAGGTLSVTLEVTGGVPGELQRSRYRGSAVASLKTSAGAGSGGIDFSTLFLQAYDQALGQVINARGARELDSEKLIAWIADEKVSEDQRRQAIRIVGSRKDASALPALTQVLKGDSRELAQAALGALTLIGDPNALEAVIEYAEAKPSLTRKQAIEAARAMGGRLAQAWLFTLSTGHVGADVRTAAERALRELEQKDLAADPAARVAGKAVPAKDEALP